jgi:hypothetical protein
MRVDEELCDVITRFARYSLAQGSKVAAVAGNERQRLVTPCTEVGTQCFPDRRTNASGIPIYIKWNALMQVADAQPVEKAQWSDQ